MLRSSVGDGGACGTRPPSPRRGGSRSRPLALTAAQVGASRRPPLRVCRWARSAIETADEGAPAHAFRDAREAGHWHALLLLDEGTTVECPVPASPPVADLVTPPSRDLAHGPARAAHPSSLRRAPGGKNPVPGFAPWAPSTSQEIGSRSITVTAPDTVGSGLPDTCAQSSRSRDPLRAAFAFSVAKRQRIREGRQARAALRSMPTGRSPGDGPGIIRLRRTGLPHPRAWDVSTLVEVPLAGAGRGRPPSRSPRILGSRLPLAPRSRTRRASPKDRGRERHERAPTDAGRGTPGAG